MRRTVTLFPSLLAACSAGPSDELELQGDCAASHAKVGHVTTLSSNAHGVAGTVEVVDDRTLLVRGFSYDGGGIEVRFYGATAGTDFSNGTSLSRNLLGERFNNEDVTLKLPVGVTLDDLDKLSVWCVPAREDFGSGTLAAPSP